MYMLGKIVKLLKLFKPEDMIKEIINFKKLPQEIIDKNVNSFKAGNK